MDALLTPRLELRPVTLPMAVAVLQGRRREEIEAVVHARMPWAWPGRALLEQVFRASLDAIRAYPETRLWGDRLMGREKGRPGGWAASSSTGGPAPTGEAKSATG